MAPVDGDVVLIAKGRDRDIHRLRAVGTGLGLGELDRPARVTVFLAQLGGLLLPGLWNAASLDLCLLSLGVPLLRGRHQRRVHDLAGHGDISRLGHSLIKPPEQPIHGPSELQALAEQPDRLGIGNPVPQRQPEKPHERKPVVDQELCPVIAQVVLRLDDQDFQHHDWIERRAATLCTVTIGQSHLQIGAENLKINRGSISLELVPKNAQPFQPVIDIEKTYLAHHQSTSLLHTQE